MTVPSLTEALRVAALLAGDVAQLHERAADPAHDMRWTARLMRARIARLGVLIDDVERAAEKAARLPPQPAPRA